MYIRARYYNSQLGQFISRDPLGYVDGMSQYRAYFVPGNVDPLGFNLEPTITLLNADWAGPLRNPEKFHWAKYSFPVDCGNETLGWLHVGDYFLTRNKARIAVEEGDAEGASIARGIGISIHFIRNRDVNPAEGEPCCCDEFKIIQVIKTDHMTDNRKLNDYIDNGGNKESPFYGDNSLGFSGPHRIPKRYPNGMNADAPFPRATGEVIETTRSIYDRPFRPWRKEGTKWNAEACLICVKNGKPDKILSCVSYGYVRAAGEKAQPVKRVKPGFSATPTEHFQNTLTDDPTTENYSWER